MTKTALGPQFVVVVSTVKVFEYTWNRVEDLLYDFIPALLLVLFTSPSLHPKMFVRFLSIGPVVYSLEVLYFM